MMSWLQLREGVRTALVERYPDATAIIVQNDCMHTSQVYSVSVRFGGWGLELVKCWRQGDWRGYAIFEKHSSRRVEELRRLADMIDSLSSRIEGIILSAGSK